MLSEPDAKKLCLDLPPLPSTPRFARHCARAALRAWQVSSEQIEAAEILVSELVTNAVAAVAYQLADPARARSDLIGLTLRTLPNGLMIEVSDGDPHPPRPTPAAMDAESGRGLMIVQALSTDWGHYYPTAGGKTVFCVLAIDDSQAPAGACLHGPVLSA